jgi:tRNA A-37 threonylcarbamoyl transferase component Bud32
MQAMFGIGGWELVAILVLLGGLAIIVGGIVGVVYLVTRPKRTEPRPVSPAPVAAVPKAAPAAPAGPAAGFPTKTVLLSRQCPQCGAALPADAPEGLCPACLLQRGFATEGGGGAGPTSFEPPPIGELAKLFPQLEILECLGRGGMGAVYKARQPRLERLVALKILAPEKQSDPQFAERFEREARVLARLNHPNIVSVFDFGEVQGRFYLIMEYVDGLTLRQVMQAAKMAPAEALELVPKICDALQYAHSQGIVHRDIKPENILLDKQGRVKIADFGIAKIAGVETKGMSLTGARDVMGTPVYVAPEQVEKPQTVDHRADIYSLGVVFYEMLTGELPLGKFSPPSKKVQLDVRLDEVVLHALEKEPARRYQEASQVKTAVETIAGTPAPVAAVGGAAAGVVAGNPSIVTAPAVALLVAGGWMILKGSIGVLTLLGLATGLGSFLGLGHLFGAISSFAIVPMLLLKFIPGGLMLFGGFQMLQRRSYAWGIAAGIFGIMACSVLGFIAGVWTLIVLSRDDARAVFGGGQTAGNPAAPLVPPQPGRFGKRVGIVAGCVLLAMVGLLVFCLAAAATALPGFFADATVPTPPLTAEELTKAGIYQESGEYRRHFSQTFPLNVRGQFSIDNVNGRTDIQGWSSNLVAITAVIHGKTGEGVKAVDIEVDPNVDHANIHTEISDRRRKFQWKWSWFRHMLDDKATVDYTVRVPQGAKLEEVSSVNGEIYIEGVAGDINASTVNGQTEIKNAQRNLKLGTVNGSIKAELETLGAGQSVSLEAVNGEMTLTLPADADATFEVGTVNGDISSEFPTVQPTKEFPVGNNLKGVLGKGEAKVKADAVNGSIKFRKGPATNRVLAPSTDT